MISLKNADGSRVLVLDETDLLRLRTEPLATPDGQMVIAISPDLVWTSAAFQEAEANGGLTAQKILSILATSIAKPAPGA